MSLKPPHWCICIPPLLVEPLSAVLNVCAGSSVAHVGYRNLQPPKKLSATQVFARTTLATVSAQLALRRVTHQNTVVVLARLPTSISRCMSFAQQIISARKPKKIYCAFPFSNLYLAVFVRNASTLFCAHSPGSTPGQDTLVGTQQGQRVRHLIFEAHDKILETKLKKPTMRSSPAWFRASACALLAAGLTMTPASARKLFVLFLPIVFFFQSLFLTFLSSFLSAEKVVAHCAKFVEYSQQECQSKLVKEKDECDCESKCLRLFFFSFFPSPHPSPLPLSFRSSRCFGPTSPPPLPLSFGSLAVSLPVY